MFDGKITKNYYPSIGDLLMHNFMKLLSVFLALFFTSGNVHAKVDCSIFGPYEAVNETLEGKIKASSGILVSKLAKGEIAKRADLHRQKIKKGYKTLGG